MVGLLLARGGEGRGESRCVVVSLCRALAAARARLWGSHDSVPVIHRGSRIRIEAPLRAMSAPGAKLESGR